MTAQLGLFSAPTPEPPPAPTPPDPWAWRVDYVETHYEDGIRAWLCNPEPGLWLGVVYDADETPPYAWSVEQGGKTVAEGVMMTREGAQGAAQEASERVGGTDEA